MSHKKQTAVGDVELAGKKSSNESSGVASFHRRMYGRRKIFTNETEITASNVLDVLNKALRVHLANREEIEYLYNYTKGRQPIINRTKQYHDEICNKIVVNRANEIVTFKTANFIGEPLQYVSRGTGEDVPQQIEKLNSFMISEGKHSKDFMLAHWMFICGLGYRLVMKDKQENFMDGDIYDEAPFEIYTLDPRNTFVVRCNDVSKKVLMGVKYVFKDAGKVEYRVFTKDESFLIHGSTMVAKKIVSSERYNFGYVPIVEYQCNPLRMGSFEVVLDLLDLINNIESNRMDGIEQFIQALMVFENADISREEFLELKDLGAIKLPSVDGRPSKVYYLNEQLDQTQTQVFVDDIWQTIKEIVGMPSQGNANTSDSSNTGAIIMRQGWQNAEARNKEIEGLWEESETDFIKIILKICNDANALTLKVSDIKSKFFHETYQDLMTKVQAFGQLMAQNVPPIQAYTVSNIVLDPESAAIEFEKYRDEREQAMNESLKEAVSRQTLVSGGNTKTETKTEEKVVNDS